MFNLPSLKIVSLFILILTFAGQASARTAGALDNSFGGGDGIAVFNIGNGGITDMVVQPDGKILVAGNGNPNTFVIIRFNADGSPDTTFGMGGKVTTEIFAQDNLGSSINGLALQSDGKIIAAGRGTHGRFIPKGSPIFTEIAVVRYNADGSLDSSFDADGKFTALVNGGSAQAEAVEIQPDGKIVVAAWNSGEQNNFIALRLNPNGTLDTTFDGDGLAATNFGLGTRPQDLKIQPDGKIVMAGYFQTDIAPVGRILFAAVRFNPNGSLDTSFDGDGKASADIGNTARAYSVALQPDGKIVLAGTAQESSNSPVSFGLVRMNPNGSLDNSFDGDGRVSTVFSIGQSGARDVAVQADGRIVAVGTTTAPSPSFVNNFAVARYLPDGSLDPTFDQDGRVTTLLFGEASAVAVAFQSDGKILVAGNTSSDGIHAMVARYISRADTYFDYDGDGKADISVFRPAVGAWYMLRSQSGFTAHQFGVSADLIAPADYDGDGKTDIAVFRDGDWYRVNSSNNQFVGVHFGQSGDVPVPADYDGDGKSDLAVYRAGNWYILNSSNNSFRTAQFGVAEDKPLVGDFDGDGKSDLAVWRPSNGTWYRINSSNDTFSPNQFGATGDLPVPADYDGDGKTDLAVYRPSVGDWYLINSSNQSFTGIHFGTAEDKPAPADFDGDGKADLVVFRPGTGTWYLLRTTAGFTGIQFGAKGDIPTPNAFVR
ncbi:MAG TPA: FG-GAP-like repeat-containing protein [Pyrinomonadaceae bacterium]|jgi:uncharacterized delta-60 repeat protein